MNRSGELHEMKEIAKQKPEKNSGYLIVWILKARFKIGPKVLLKHFTS